ncbi:unnamed protein product [Rhodiola kirilowii]
MLSLAEIDRPAEKSEGQRETQAGDGYSTAEDFPVGCKWIGPSLMMLGLGFAAGRI